MTRKDRHRVGTLPEPRPITLRLGRETYAALKARAGEEWGEGLPSVSQLAIERYMEMCRRELATVTLDEASWSLLRDAWSKSKWTADTIAYIDAQIADAIQLNGLAKKWAVDGAQIVATIRSWSYAQRVAVVDEVERWFRTSRSSGQQVSP
jgi:hypothetical protein